MTETVKEINRARITTAPFPSPDLGVGDNAGIKYSIILCAALSRRLFYCLEVRTMGKLTPKQARFVEEYLVDLNATAAAIRAGYSWQKLPREGFYTYFLVDPQNNEIFYVGKGTGKRVYRHERDVLNGNADNGAKCLRILEIHKAGLRILHLLFSLHDREEDAYDMERVLIEALSSYGLTNISHGIVPQEEAVAQSARYLYNRLLPYGIWRLTLSQDKADSIARVFGSLKAAYSYISLNLKALAGLEHE